MKILIPVSVGHICDRITILELKPDSDDRNQELVALNRALSELAKTRISNKDNCEVLALTNELRGINRDLWNYESDIRKPGIKGSAVGKLGRAIAETNDRRIAVKNKIDALVGGAVEKKDYSGR